MFNTHVNLVFANLIKSIWVIVFEIEDQVSFDAQKYCHKPFYFYITYT